MWNRIIAAVVLLCFGGILFPLDSGFIPGSEEEAVLRVYLDRAEDEHTVAGWERIVDAGLSRLEGDAETYRDMVDRRFKRWLEGRIASDLPRADLSVYLRAMGEHRSRLLYTRDPETGLPETDATGAPVVDTGSPEEAVEDFVSAHEDLKNSSISAWEASALREAGNLPGASENLVQEVVAERKKKLNALYDEVFARMKSGFLVELLRDTRSLRKKSEDQTARAVGDRLFAAVEEELAGEARALERASAAADYESFEEDYRRVFEQGLDSWTKAEARLLEERVQWEQDALEHYSAGEESWQNVFATLEEKRKAWFEQMNHYYRQGLETFSNREEDMRSRIGEFQSDLAQRREEEIAGIRADVENLVSVYREAREYEHLAGDTVEFLEALLSSEVEDPGPLEDQIATWRGIERSRRETAEEAAEELERLSGGILSAYGPVPVTDLELELERVRLRLGKLEEQIDIARAVASYAGDTSSSRQTEAETLRAFEVAAERVDATLEEYRLGRAEFEAMRDRVESLRQGYEEALAAAEEATGLREEARRAYEDACDRILISDPGVYEEAIEELSNRLYDFFPGSAEDGTTSYRRLVISYIEDSLWQYAEGREQTRRRISDAMIHGTEDGILSAEALVDRLNRLTVFTPDWENPPEQAEFELLVLQETGIEADSADYVSLSTAYRAFLESPEEEREFARRRVVGHMEAAAERICTELQRRRLGVLYLTGEDDAFEELLRLEATPGTKGLLSAWKDLPVPEREDLRSTEDERLFFDTLSRVKAEIGALEECIALSAEETTVDDVSGFARLLYTTNYFPEPAAAEERLAMLERIRDLLESSEDDVTSGSSLASLATLRDEDLQDYLEQGCSITVRGFPPVLVYRESPPKLTALRMKGFLHDYDEEYADLSLLYGEVLPFGDVMTPDGESRLAIIDGLTGAQNLRDAAEYITTLPPEPGFLRFLAGIYYSSKSREWDTTAEQETLRQDLDACTEAIETLREEIALADAEEDEAEVSVKLERLSEMRGEKELLTRALSLADNDGFPSVHLVHEGVEYDVTWHDAVIDALRSSETFRVTGDGGGRDALLEGSARARGLIEELAGNRESLALLEEYDAEGLYEQTVVPAEEVLNAADERYTAAMDDVKAALRALEDALDGQEAVGNEVSELYNRYHEALLERQKAREIYEYAISGYERPEHSPSMVLEELERDYRTTEERVIRLEGLLADDRGRQINDEELTTLAGTLEQAYQRLFMYRRLEGVLDAEVGSKLENLEEADEEMIRELSEVMNLPENYRLEKDAEAVDMGRFAEYSLAELAEMTSDAAGREQVTATFIDQWIDGVMEAGDGFIRQCMMAYAYEAENTRWDILSPAGYTNGDGETVHLFTEPEADLNLRRLLDETGDPPITPEYIYGHEGKKAWGALHEDDLYQGFRILMQGDYLNIPIRSMILRELRQAETQEALPKVIQRIGKARQAATVLGIVAAGYAAAAVGLIAAVVSIPAGLALLAEAALYSGLALSEKVSANRLQQIVNDAPDYSAKNMENRRGFFQEMEEYLGKRDVRFALEEDLSSLLGGDLSGLDEMKSRLWTLAGEAPEDLHGDFTTAEEDIVGDLEDLLVSGTTCTDTRDFLADLAEALEAHIRDVEGEYNNRAGDVLEELSAAYEDYAAGSYGEDDSVLRGLFAAPSWSRAGEYNRLRTMAEGLRTYGSADLEVLRLEMLADAISTGAAQVFDNAAKLEYEELRLDMEMLVRRRERWESRMAVLVEEGRSRWASSMTTALGRHLRWQEEVKELFYDGVETWDRRVFEFKDRKNRWIREASRAWATGQMASMATELGLDDAVQTDIPDISFPEGPAENDFSMFPDNRALEELMRRAADLVRGEGDIKVALKFDMPLVRRDAGLRSRILEYQSRVKEDITRKTVATVALRFKKRLRESVEDLKYNITRTNRSVAESLGSTLLAAGYSFRGGRYHRRVAVDESVAGGVETEEQTIEGYTCFVAPEFVPATDLSVSGVTGLSSAEVKRRIAAAEEGLLEYQQLIFGPAEGETAGSVDNLAENLASLYSREAQGWAAALESGEQESGDIPEGLFYFHVGYAPAPPRDGETETTGGYGESGRIYGSFFEQHIRQVRGAALLQAPAYEVKLWDDDTDNDGEADTFLEAPSYRDLVNIGTGVAAGILTGGIGSVLCNLADDAVFSLADLGNGKDAGETLLGFGKKAVTSFLSVGASSLGSLGSDALGTLVDANFTGAAAGFLNTTADTAIHLASASLGGYGSAAVQALQLEETGFVFDRAAWKQATDGLGTRLLGGTLAAGISSGLDNRLYGFHGSLGEDMGALHSLVGGAAGAALEYGLTGRTTLNVLNVADLTGGAANTGLLEVRLGDGSLFGFGSRGLDISVGNLVQAASGVEAYRIDREVSTAGHGDNAVALRGLASLDYLSEAGGLYEDLLSGEARLSFDEVLEAAAETVAEGGDRVIHLDSGDSTNHQKLLMGITLAHEAERDGYIGDEAEQFVETVNAVVAHALAAQSVAARYGWGFDPAGMLAGESALVLDSLKSGSLETLASYVGTSYDTSADYWKLIKNDDGSGAIVWDGSRDLTNEAGDLLQADDTGSFSRSLMNYLGKEYVEGMLSERGLSPDSMDEDEMAYAMMTGSGVMWDEEARKYTVIPAVSLTGEEMTSLLRFDVDQDQGVNLGKISQRSESIAYYADEYGGDENFMRKSGCYYLSTLAAVQTAAGKNLTAEQIRRLTEIGLREDLLAVDADGIGTTGPGSREALSRYAFAELGILKELDFNDDGTDGAILVGKTIYGHNHAREGTIDGEELYDPYSFASYEPGKAVYEMYKYDVVDTTTSNIPYYAMYLRYRRYEEKWRG